MPLIAIWLFIASVEYSAYGLTNTFFDNLICLSILLNIIKMSHFQTFSRFLVVLIFLGSGTMKLAQEDKQLTDMTIGGL